VQSDRSRTSGWSTWSLTGVADGKVLSLIRSMLTAGALVDGVFESVVAGTPQGGMATAPNQLATWPVGACGGEDRVADGDVAVAADEHFADDEPQDALALVDVECVGGFGEPGEEPKVFGELEVCLGVVQLGVERIELGGERGLAFAQRGHPGAQLLERDELFLVGLDQPAAGGLHAREVAFEAAAAVGGRLASLIETTPHRLADRRAQRQPTRTRVASQPSDQRRREADREHRRALRHHDPVRHRLRRVYVPTRLTLGQTMLDLQRAHRVRRRAVAQQHHRAVDPFGVLVGEGSAAGHQPLGYHRITADSFSPAAESTLKLEVRYCVGAVASPLLANVYAHYVLDLWAHQWRTRHARGDVVIVGWADDFVVGFEYRDDAERFWADLRDRLAKFNLELNAEKTRLIEFGRFAAERRAAPGLGKPETFAFLGFTHICGKTGNGRFQLKRITEAKRLRAKLHKVKTECRRRMHLPIPEQGQWLGAVVRGHLNYYAVPGDVEAVEAFGDQATRHWHKALRRRSQKRSRLTWEQMHCAQQWLPPAKIKHPWPDARFDVRIQARSFPHAGICAGGGPSPKAKAGPYRDPAPT